MRDFSASTVGLGAVLRSGGDSSHRSDPPMRRCEGQRIVTRIKRDANGSVVADEQGKWVTEEVARPCGAELRAEHRLRGPFLCSVCERNARDSAHPMHRYLRAIR